MQEIYDNNRFSISSSGRATTTNWIQTYTSTYTMHGNSSSCSGFGDGEITFFPDPEEAVRNRQYACSNSEEDASLGIKSAVPKIICGGSPELYECSSLVDIKKGLVTTDVWDEQFQ